MALESVTTHTAVCDRCCKREIMAQDPKDTYYTGGWEYWHGRNSNIGKLWLLCPGCVTLTERFLTNP